LRGEANHSRSIRSTRSRRSVSEEVSLREGSLRLMASCRGSPDLAGTGMPPIATNPEPDIRTFCLRLLIRCFLCCLADYSTVPCEARESRKGKSRSFPSGSSSFSQRLLCRRTARGMGGSCCTCECNVALDWVGAYPTKSINMTLTSSSLLATGSRWVADGLEGLGRGAGKRLQRRQSRA
jgi:hypothetical protein